MRKGSPSLVTTVRSWFSRVLAPHLGRCYRCKTSLWGPIRNESHTTNFENGRGCFPLCEKCWSTLTPNERLPYYDALVNTWISGFPENRDEYEKDREAIHRAVMAGV